MNKPICKLHAGITAALLWILATHGVADETSTLITLRQRCLKAGWNAENIASIERIMADCTASELPLDLLALRLQEGLAKQVDQRTVVQAVESRLQIMQQAKKLTQVHNCPAGNMAETVTTALEAGVAQETIGNILANAKNQRPGQLIALVDASRTLVVSGWDEKAVAGLTADFQQRNLRRSEMIRAVRTLVAMGPAAAKDLSTVRTRLWGSRQNSIFNEGRPNGGPRGFGRSMGAGDNSDFRRGGHGNAGNGAGK
jgi:hypothetical protein